jgi:hypothetical protein
MNMLQVINIHQIIYNNPEGLYYPIYVALYILVVLSE